MNAVHKPIEILCHVLGVAFNPKHWSIQLIWVCGAWSRALVFNLLRRSVRFYDPSGKGIITLCLQQEMPSRCACKMSGQWIESHRFVLKESINSNLESQGGGVITYLWKSIPAGKIDWSVPCLCLHLRVGLYTSLSAFVSLLCITTMKQGQNMSSQVWQVYLWKFKPDTMFRLCWSKASSQNGGGQLTRLRLASTGGLQARKCFCQPGFQLQSELKDSPCDTMLVCMPKSTRTHLELQMAPPAVIHVISDINQLSLCLL